MKFTLFNLIFIVLMTSGLNAQNNPDDDCPAPPTFLVGDYQITDVQATVGPANGTENFETGTYTISAQGNTRTFQTGILPDFNNDIETVDLILNCGVIQIEDINPGLTCDNVSSYTFTTTVEANSTTYSLTGSDDSFTINYVEDPQGSCGGPYNSSFSINKVCSKPQDLQIINSTSSSVELSWVDTNNTTITGNTYTIEYGPLGFSLGSGQTMTGISGNTAIINNLQDDTTYDFYVSASCSDGTSSQVNGPLEYDPDFYFENGTCKCPDANFGDTGTFTINGQQQTFTKRTRAQLDALISTNNFDPQIALTCTSGITDMSNLFEDTNFNFDISHWDTSNVTNMEFMFWKANGFNQDIDDWDTSNVTNMSSMFEDAYLFNQNISSWDTSSVTDISFMFFDAAAFDQPLNDWDVSNVTNMRGLFGASDVETIFNHPLDNWDVSNVTDMRTMFQSNLEFDQNLNGWDVSQVTNMSRMFNGAQSFNQDIGNWDTANVTDMSLMFNGSLVFDQDINSWDTSNVTDMSNMFRFAQSFNQNIGNWDTSNVFDMTNMFFSATSFNQDLSNWCVELIPVEPTDFSNGAPLQDIFKPAWGITCNGSNLDFYV